MVEEVAPAKMKAPVMRSGVNGGNRSGVYGSVRPQRLGDVAMAEQPRLKTGMEEFDRVVGGGILRGSLTLVAGDPGIGKSTLMTELGRHLSDHKILYVTGEESAQQVKLRARRLDIDPDSFYLFPETNVEAILAAAHDIQPDVMVVDSIQTVYRADLTSAPGSV
ncbi:MAG: ATPase domain-containing protein, partial [Rubricoccaceae bacterium]|nr:ATPase domain-containing protein [Rubricoccaceae bacterium]